MRYGHFRYYWLALLAGVTGHQMLLNFTMGWLMFELTGEERDLAFLGIAIAVPEVCWEASTCMCLSNARCASSGLPSSNIACPYA